MNEFNPPSGSKDIATSSFPLLSILPPKVGGGFDRQIHPSLIINEISFPLCLLCFCFYLN